MSARKMGFVLYFDSYHSIAFLSPEQKGELLSALYQYAQSVCDHDEAPEEAVSRFPKLDPDTRMAFCFMAGNIRRDTQKWLQRQRRCQESARERVEKHREGHGGGSAREREDAWKYI